jgi:hypothetical protein
VLIQFSENLGFFGACPNFDPNVDGHYAFRAAVSDANGVLLASVQVNAIVGNPINAPKISADGMIESQAEGYKFPDGTVQTTAAVSGPPPSPFPDTYIATAHDDVGAQSVFVGCSAGDKIIGGGARCHDGFANWDRLGKTCPADAVGACRDGGGTDFTTWAAQCDTAGSKAYVYAICLDMTP